MLNTLIVDGNLFKQAIKRLKDYAEIIDMENGEAIENLINLLPDTECLIEELEGQLPDTF